MSIIDGKMFHMNAELLTSNELDPSPLRDTELVQEIQFLTARLAAKGNNHANKLLEGLDLNVRQFSVLALAASDLKPTQREMSAFVALDPSQIVALVDTLEDRDLVKLGTDRRDRRSKNIVATDAGEKLYRKARATTITAEVHVLANLTEAERDQLRELLTKATLSQTATLCKLRDTADAASRFVFASVGTARAIAAFGLCQTPSGATHQQRPQISESYNELACHQDRTARRSRSDRDLRGLPLLREGPLPISRQLLRTRQR